MEVKETTRESKVTFGIIVDESGSMRKGGKLKAAMEAALALWYLIRRDPKNDVATVVFSREVKVAYLITDSEPNVENGRVVGFDKAKTCVIEEAARMRKEGVILNVVMLGSSTNLRELAQEMATRNLGTVIFTTPENLSRTIIRSFQKLK